MKITGRSSSITNAFINSIIPVVPPTDEEIKEALEVLGMDHESYCCAYCGDKATEWDHLRPLVKDKRPTGNISEIHNLIPSCGKCNQSKGNKEWEAWMRSSALLSPASRKISDLEYRIEKIRNYEKWGQPTKIDFEEVVGLLVWEEHWANWEKIQSFMKEAQLLATRINQSVAKAHRHSQSSQLDNAEIKPTGEARLLIDVFDIRHSR
ncbi:HNH endonuclease [Pollutimonas nitritireducens]|uniref:HNH endonuclease n=2 Tax=Pollutimonas nitritireducens TaxID=2045209 RepID=A0A2N4UD85_9BURK|nr:HNH endonuclease [Pollutimonas nitritireducens]